MKRLGTGLVLGFHGCEREAAEAIIGGEAFRQSDKPYDWLGPGAYFWEGDDQRALEWARDRPRARAFKSPAVVGAVIDLGNCLDLTTRSGLDLIAYYHGLFKEAQQAAGLDMPVNEDLAGDRFGDRLLRYLDRAVIAFLHASIEAQITSDEAVGVRPSVERFDTVRGLFPEGAPAYEGAGFMKKTHTQIAVRNPACILGAFWPRENIPE